MFHRRKIAFWVVLGVLVLTGLVYWVVLPLLADNRERVPIRVAVCGAVNRPAVYSMEQGSDLGMLIRRVWAASRMVVPSGTVTGIELIVRFTI
mgnify:CR=1 FL=1